MSNSQEWWSEYVPADKMVSVAIDFDALQNKMKRVNIKICENCNACNDRQLFNPGYAGMVMNCPVVEEIDIVTETKLPSDCTYRLEQIIAFQELDDG